MKTPTSILLWVCMTSILLINSSYAAEIAGTIKSVKGEVSILRGEETISASTGMPLMVTDKIVTGANSAAGITLLDSTLLSFGANSISQLNEFHYDPVERDGNLLISLLKGTMRFVTGLLGKQNPESVTINLPTGSVGIRGTDFIVSVAEEEK